MLPISSDIIIIKISTPGKEGAASVNSPGGPTRARTAAVVAPPDFGSSALLRMWVREHTSVGGPLKGTSVGNHVHNLCKETHSIRNPFR